MSALANPLVDFLEEGGFGFGNRDLVISRSTKPIRGGLVGMPSSEALSAAFRSIEPSELICVKTIS
jgi:hypothetical protein